jgi:transposase
MIQTTIIHSHFILLLKLLGIHGMKFSKEKMMYYPNIHLMKK